MAKEKIIREWVNAPFKEIKKEEEETEDLEEEIMPKEADFSNFSSEAVAPVLRTTPIPAAETGENLEQDLENIPAVQGAGTGGGVTAEYLSDYEQIEYEEVERDRDRKRDREMNITLMTPLTPEQELREGRTMDMGAWRRETQEGTGGERRTREQDYVLRARRAEEETELPFQRKERKRRLSI